MIWVFRGVQSLNLPIILPYLTLDDMFSYHIDIEVAILTMNFLAAPWVVPCVGSS